MVCLAPQSRLPWERRVTFTDFDDDGKVRRYSLGNDIQLPWGTTWKPQVICAILQLLSQSKAHIRCLMLGTTISASNWQILTSQYKSLYLQIFCAEAFTREDGTTIFCRTTTSKQPGVQIKVLLKLDSWEAKTSSCCLFLCFFFQVELH